MTDPVNTAAETVEAQTQESSRPKESALTQAANAYEIPELNATTLIECGVHYGHSTRNWDPRMKRYIFGRKNGIHIINVKETLRGAIRARHFLSRIASAGLDILIVGTKKQAADVVRMEAQGVDMPYVATRWLGGTLTNHSTIRTRLSRLVEIEDLKSSGKFRELKKKQQSMVEREHKKISFNLEGLRNLDKLPAALLVVDATHEKNAVAEAKRLNIPVVSIVDTDTNPDDIDILIPANDDSLRGVQILLHYICKGIADGKQLHETGRGIKDKATLQPASLEEMEKARDKGGRGGRGGDRGGRGGDRTRSRGGRTPEKRAEKEAATDEAIQVAEAQGARASAQVRVKPQRKKEDGEANPAAATEGAPANAEASAPASAEASAPASTETSSEA